MQIRHPSPCFVPEICLSLTPAKGRLFPVLTAHWGLLPEFHSPNFSCIAAAGATLLHPFWLPISLSHLFHCCMSSFSVLAMLGDFPQYSPLFSSCCHHFCQFQSPTFAPLITSVCHHWSSFLSLTISSYNFLWTPNYDRPSMTKRFSASIVNK